MSDKYFIKNADIVNEGEIFRGSVLIENGKIKTILKSVFTKLNLLLL